jgi:Cof subfamily protein (haloacid dehalogenase superfamily)/HAD superfamily hydrolase (TIGR01509 family)
VAILEAMISGDPEAAPRIKLLIADVDGTLLTSGKVLTPATCQAVDRLRAAGVTFTITSGRPPRGMAALMAPLKLTGPVAAFNGGLFVKSDLKTILAQRTIALPVARQTVDQLLAAGLDVWIYQGADWFLRRADAFRVARERSNVGFDPIVVDDLHAVLDAPIKIVGVSEDRSLVARCESELNQRLGTEASAARSTAFYLDVTHPEANKGMVVREASRILEIPLPQIATIGDMPNDVPMLSISGLSVAMGNANAEVQGVARHVSRTNEEDGFAYAIDTFVLGAPPFAQTPLGLPPRTRACLFGLDGVLTQGARLHAEAWKRLFDHYLLKRARAAGQPFVPFDPVRDYGRNFDERLPLEAVRSFLVSRGVELPEHTVAALVERKGEIFVDLLGHERLEAYEGSFHFLRLARGAGLSIGVVSSSTHCREALLSAGLADLCDVWIDGAFAAAERLAGKPAPDTFLAGARALGVIPEETALFDDEPAGVAAGRRGHFCYVVGVDRVGRAAELRQSGADAVVSDLAGLVDPRAWDGHDALGTGSELSPAHP